MTDNRPDLIDRLDRAIFGARTIHMMRPRVPDDGTDDIDLYNGCGERFPLLDGHTWQRVPRREMEARQALGWLLPNAPLPREPVDRLGFPIGRNESRGRVDD